MRNWRDLWSRHPLWIGAALCGALVMLCYGFTLGLPFFYDDLPIMTWLRQHHLIEVWTHSSENAYYRPLAFTVYKIGNMLPYGARQVALHGVNLLVHWAGAMLVMLIVKLCNNQRPRRAVLAATLFAVYPFLYLAIPWVTALSHPLVTALTALAVYAALRAERDDETRWWRISLAATTLAPFAHESGPVCGLIVGGWVMIQYGPRLTRRQTTGVALGVALNVGAVLLRGLIPGVGETQFSGLNDLYQNTVFFLHGLVYPLAPIIGWLVHRQGWHDFTVVGITTVAFALLLLGLARRRQNRRWIARDLWWWACAALPAVASLKYGELFTSPRLYALSMAGVTMLWAGIIGELSQAVRNAWGRRLVWSLLAGAIIVQNVTFLSHQRVLFASLNHVYGQVLDLALDEENAPLGFVNLPAWLAWPDQTYALISEGVLFIPSYTTVSEFIEVNRGWRPARGVMNSAIIQEGERVMYGFRGAWLDGEQVRQFAIDHHTVALTRHAGTRFELEPVGNIRPGVETMATPPLVQFENGPAIASASVREMPDGRWALALTWLVAGPIEAEIFVHVRNQGGNVVTQADGAVLGRMLPMSFQQPGDRILDIRYLTLPGGSGPYNIMVGIYNAGGRFPAFVNGARVPDDAALVVTIPPGDR